MLTVLIIQLTIGITCFASTERTSQKKDQNSFRAKAIHHLVFIEEKNPSKPKLLQTLRRELDEDQLTRQSSLVSNTLIENKRIWGKLVKGSVNIYPTSFGVKNG